MTEGQRILVKAYAHIACGNGPEIEEGAGMFDCRFPHYPWTYAEQCRVGIELKRCYELIASEA